MTIWFTSDLHFYHVNILRFCERPYEDVYHMAEGLINNYNSYVDQNDTVYFLGDICFGTREETLPVVKRLNGRKVLIPGNHDYCHEMYATSSEKFQRHYEMYLQYFDDVLFGFPELDGFRMSHFPYYEGIDYQGRDFSLWQSKDDGMPLLCGHVHDEWRINRTGKNTFMYNVGVDANGLHPVSFDFIKDTYLSYC